MLIDSGALADCCTLSQGTGKQSLGEMIVGKSKGDILEVQRVERSVGTALEIATSGAAATTDVIATSAADEKRQIQETEDIMAKALNACGWEKVGYAANENNTALGQL